MKYSILFPYYNRYGQTLNTINNFYKLYGNRNDWEVIIAESYNNLNSTVLHDQLINIISYSNKLRINVKYVYPKRDNKFSPVILFNEAAKVSSGKFYIISNPETYHVTNILSQMDSHFDDHPGRYYVASCMNVDENGNALGWYQHSKVRNACYHFCTGISAELYRTIGGFDENYTNGIAYDDNDFINNIRFRKIKIVADDEMITAHQRHDSSYQQNMDLCKINENYYLNKWNFASSEMVI